MSRSPLRDVLLMICSEEDLPSCNMRDRLLRKRGWEALGPAAGDGSHGEVLGSGDMALMSIPGLHIRSDHVDRMAAESCGRAPSTVVFLSRHKAASGIPTLTVHPIGNFGTADFGGRDGALVPPSPHLMTQALREMGDRCRGLGFQISYEVTHHGPWLETPTLFLEIGSDESRWGDLDAAACLVDSILRAQESQEEHPVLVGVGGGHYAPQFSDIALGSKSSFGHMVPGYALAGLDDEERVRRVMMAAESSGTGLVYMHRKSMKRSEASRLQALLESEGLEMVSSKDLDAL